MDTRFWSPTNFAGFQYPHSGNCYIGLAKMHSFTKEFVRIKLKTPLESGLCYSLELFYALGNTSDYAINNLAMVLSLDSFKTCIADAFSCPGYSVVYPLPQLGDSQINDDSLNWRQLKGEYQAMGGEQWLTIGWFVPSDQIDTLRFPQPIFTSFSYYYIDDVSVHLCKDDEEAVILPQFISPNGDLKNDYYVIDSLPPNSKVSFYNRWGNEVYRSNNYQNEWNGTWNGQLLPSGTYYVVVQMPHGTIKSTFIELVY